MREVVIEVAQQLEPMVRKKGLDTTYRVADDRMRVYTDRTKLKQILLNLLSNAVKFTHVGWVRLDATRVGAVHAAWARAAHAQGFKLYNFDHTLSPAGRSDDAIRGDGAHYSNDGANRVAPTVARAIRAAALARASATR